MLGIVSDIFYINDVSGVGSTGNVIKTSYLKTVLELTPKMSEI
jgi:hypothetical protein